MSLKTEELYVDLAPQSISEEQDIHSDLMTLNMGPQHPSTHGVLRLELKTDGEVVKKVITHIGYLHRCFEKHAEALDYAMVIPYVDRMDYVASMNNDLGFCLAVEKLCQLAIPRRADFIRIIVCELNRIASHLLAFGTYGMDVGAFTPFLYAFRDREKILDIFEEICGARLLYNYIRFGGVSRDITDEVLKKIDQFLDYFLPKIDEYHGLLSGNKIFIERTAKIGVLDSKTAISYGISGPNLRGSGLKWDLRKDESYSIYSEFDFNIPVGEGLYGPVGSCWDRYIVRLKEMEESIKIIKQALNQIPVSEESVVPKAQNKFPKGEVFMRSEAPRGELGFYLMSDGKKKPFRVKAKSPCFTALSVLDEICRNTMIADVVAILGSIDIVLGEVDR